MAFVTGRILSMNGTVIVEYIEIGINTLHFGTQEYWYGSCEVPGVPVLHAPAYRLQLADGREGKITHITTWISGENIRVSFEGSIPLTAGA